MSTLHRSLELTLLRCTLPSLPSPPSPSPSPSPSTTPLSLLTTSIQTGNYLTTLSSETSRSIFPPSLLASLTDPELFYSQLDTILEAYLVENSGDDGSEKFLSVVSLAVAALLAFVQCNFTGPLIELPSVPLPWIEITNEKEWESWARIQLMSSGSDLIAKFSNLQYIVFAKILLMKTRDVIFSEKATCAAGLWTISWWLARVIYLQQEVLHERCSSLLDLLQVFMGECLDRLGDVEKVTSYWGGLLDEGEASTIASMLQLEAGLVEYTFGRVDYARNRFGSAAQALSLELSVTGALGFRTIHQVDPKAQMVLVANKTPFPGTSSSLSTNSSDKRDASVSEANSGQNLQEIREASDVLMAPRLVSDDGKKSNDITSIQSGRTANGTLTPVQQAVILAHCLLLQKTSRQDELQRWEMAPYIEAVDSQQSSCFTIKFSCDVLRIRWESTRSRTKERALLMMDKMVQGLSEPLPEVLERVRSRFGVHIPAVPLLKKEYGELLISQGLVGEALKIFEGLELWDNLIYCYRLLEKKAAAVDLIKARLMETPNDPTLWCSLGDVTNDDTCYEKALEVSKNRSARAMRSLARSAYNRGDYERSKILWESAMALNSLYPDGWFALGAAALKCRDVDKALDGFTRAVQLDPDNGEAWNNVACLHMMKDRNEESFIAFKEALKFKRKSWQMWENYGQVAANVGNFSQAIEAIRMVFDLTGGKRYDGVLLERVLEEMERRVSDQSCVIHVGDEDGTDKAVVGSESRETARLMEVLGKVLQQIVRGSGSGEIWGLYARWHKMKGDLTMCSEALLKQVRSYQGSEVWKDVARFKKFANASLDLCKIYLEIASSTGSRRELHAADMHLRNTIKQASEFVETEEFKALQDCLSEVQTRLQSNS